MNSKQHGARKGFTLIELLVVIAIIGLLASIILASLDSARKKGRDARRIADMKQLQLALELYFDASSTYPTGSTAITVPTAGTSPSAQDIPAGLAPAYISSIPTDPTSATGYYYQYEGITSGGGACSTAPCPAYVLVAGLESGANSSGWVGTPVTGGVACVNNSSAAPYMYCVHS
ncbi:MAG TPA: prepilin-type N-terminal cleavage/methylation domain-containing protein [Candidatus Paceibacterota bacterium]|nr:prepilin-type N-terminal cleavage/methylation domain-containing protein [Candidatus Paceibacterota bacterium]